MKKKVLLTVLLMLVSFGSLSGFALAQEEKPTIVVTTTVLGSIVNDLLGKEVEIITLVPPGSCPAHFDLKPSDVEAIRKAKVILAHGFEPWIEKISSKVIKVSGGWNTADLAKKLYKKVAKVLKTALPQYLNNIESNLTKALKKLDSLEKKVAKDRKGLKDIRAIVMKWQAPFVKWLGISILATYPPPETMSASQIERIIAVGRVKKAMLVIDNLQSGISMGRKLSAEIGAVHVVLTNFPGSLPGVKNIPDMIEHNLKQVLNGVKAYRHQVKRIARLEAEISDLNGRLKFWKAVSAVALGIVIIESFMLLKRR